MPLGLQTGTLITPTVRLVEQLGQGGMGTVWLADHLTLHTRVVVKVMSTDALDDAESVARFSDEAMAAAQVRSPHVVQMLDHGVTGEGIPFIVMELLEGRDLAMHIDERGPLPIAEVVTIVTQVAKALEKVHELGIVHRDIKPENIFLFELGNGETLVKLLDFGIAKSLEGQMTHATQAGVMMGTPYYMSPEAIVCCRDVDAHADLWGLAVVAFQALTGGDAFPGDSVAAITLKIYDTHRPVPSERVRSIPPAIDRWFERAFALDRAARFGNAREMSDALVRAYASIGKATTIRRVKSRAFVARGAAFVVAIGSLGLVLATARPRVRSPVESTIEGRSAIEMTSVRAEVPRQSYPGPREPEQAGPTGGSRIAAAPTGGHNKLAPSSAPTSKTPHAMTK